MASMYSCSSLVGFVSSKRRWQRPPNSRAIPELRQIDFAWPMWRYPFGSGGKRVTTVWCRPSRRSAATISRMKSPRSGEDGVWLLTGATIAQGSAAASAIPRQRTRGEGRGAGESLLREEAEQELAGAGVDEGHIVVHQVWWPGHR